MGKCGYAPNILGITSLKTGILYVILMPVEKPLKNKVLSGFSADSRRRPYTFRYMPRGIRQMSMQAWPLDSLRRENESSVRDLPLVKQN